MFDLHLKTVDQAFHNCGLSLVLSVFCVVIEFFLFILTSNEMAPVRRHPDPTCHSMYFKNILDVTSSPVHTWLLPSMPHSLLWPTDPVTMVTPAGSWPSFYGSAERWCHAYITARTKKLNAQRGKILQFWKHSEHLSPWKCVCVSVWALCYFWLSHSNCPLSVVMEMQHQQQHDSSKES